MGSSVNGTFVNYTPTPPSSIESTKSNHSANEQNTTIKGVVDRNIKNVDRSSLGRSSERIKRRICTPYNIIKGAFWSCIAISALASGVLLGKFTSFSSPAEGNDLYSLTVENSTSSSTGQAFNLNSSSSFSFTEIGSSSISLESSSSSSSTGSIVISSSSSTGRKLTPTTVASAKLFSRNREQFATITFTQYSSDEVRAVIDGFIYNAIRIPPKVTIKDDFRLYNTSSCEEIDNILKEIYGIIS